VTEGQAYADFIKRIGKRMSSQGSVSPCVLMRCFGDSLDNYMKSKVKENALGIQYNRNVT
jgi:hypothetical protein